MHRVMKLLRDRSGANMLEAAIVAPLLFLLTLGIVDFASLFYAYLALENGVSIATRFAVTGNTLTNPQNGQVMSRTDSIKQAMRDATPTLTIPDAYFTFQHMAPGTGNWVGGVGGPNEIEKVTIDYTWDLLTPLIRPFFTNGQIHLVVDSTMKNEGRFQ